ncbi:hypothetical protein [Streptomyces purpurogeneiscleroticus]|uniref:hypothetical protein n=1 Tax=Streptomyces purpurogeneiscleroticus TaxID=68259 RepID=UPI001CBD713F|nr:hypothetical protein [Streptomyces purpurogeneiscleroticus]
MIGAPATTLKNTYKNCRLGRSDLTELFARATGHIPSTHVTVTTEHNNTRWTADSLSDLINSVTSASSYDSHVPWDNLQFRAEVPGGELEVLIDITPKWLHVRVEGTNDILVHGQQARIELFLRNRGASEAQEPHRQRTAVLTTVAVCAVSVLVVWGSLPQGPLVDPRVATIVVFGCSLAALTLTLPPLFFSRRAKLDVLQDIPRGSTWRRLTPMERATVIGLYVTALGVVGTVASGVVDVAGLFGE